tara:strand:+ start:224 stop:433 length:210 start_codon:yes stop_codon:yes gene_type:complete
MKLFNFLINILITKKQKKIIELKERTTAIKHKTKLVKYPEENPFASILNKENLENKKLKAEIPFLSKKK